MLTFVTRQTRKLAIVYVIATLLFDIVLVSHAPGQTPAKAEEKTITLGIVSEINQPEIADHFRDFVRYVANKLSSASPIDGKIVVTSTPSQLAGLLTQKKVDFYMDSPYATYVINGVHGAGKLLLRRWKRGVSEYQALIFTKRESETKRLEDLRGKIIVFEDPGSTSGHFLPKFFLSRRGLKLSEKTRIETQISPGEVGYIFAYSQDKLVDLVLTKQVAAGAFSNDDYAALDEKKKLDITVLVETDRLPRHLLSIRTDMGPALASRLERILLSMHEDPEGQLVLQKTSETTKFDALPGGEAAMRRRLLETFYSPDKN
jgi:phosphonate transport system substrate-binding protein